ncbi:MAG: hypothetical protein HYT63_03510 [Candidatus Yanofskybacteria bacterium]|nr:hypothetical protein [Candidatus Yanofskybacteria bacterium]
MKLNTRFLQFPSSFALLTLPCQDSANLGECVSGIYSWSLTVVGIVAFVQIVYAGWMYLTAAGNTSKTGEAMKKISNAVLGIVLLFSSYLILNTINPDLVGGSLGLPNLKGDEATKIDYGDNSSSTTTLLNESSTTTTTTKTTDPNTPDWSSVTPSTPLVVGFRDYQQAGEILDRIGPQTNAEICLVGSGFAPPNMGMYIGGLGTFSITPHTTTKATLRLDPLHPRFYPAWQNITQSASEVGYFARGEYQTDFVFVYLDIENGLGTVRPQRPCTD